MNDHANSLQLAKVNEWSGTIILFRYNIFIHYNTFAIKANTHSHAIYLVQGVNVASPFSGHVSFREPPAAPQHQPTEYCAAAHHGDTGAD